MCRTSKSFNIKFKPLLYKDNCAEKGFAAKGGVLAGNYKAVL